MLLFGSFLEFVHLEMGFEDLSRETFPLGNHWIIQECESTLFYSTIKLLLATFVFFQSDFPSIKKILGSIWL